MFLGKGVLNICSKFTGEHPCRSAISINVLCNFIEIALQHGCSPVNLRHIFGTPFFKNTSRWLLLSNIHLLIKVLFISGTNLCIRFLVPCSVCLLVSSATLSCTYVVKHFNFVTVSMPCKTNSFFYYLRFFHERSPFTGRARK